MTTFCIIKNGIVDIVRTKHIFDGNYHIKANRTTNRFRIHWITNTGTEDKPIFKATSFYKGFEANPDEFKIERIEY